MKKNLACPYCGSLLELNIGYTGADWDCKKGEGSGYGWELSLDCTNEDCATIFTLGNLKELGDFSEIIDGKKSVK